MVRGRFSTQGALRDPGLWYTTLRGKWLGVDSQHSQPRVRFATLGFGIQPLRGKWLGVDSQPTALRDSQPSAFPIITPRALYPKAQGRRCGAPWGETSTRKCLISTQGALRDAGFWYRTPSG